MKKRLLLEISIACILIFIFLFIHSDLLFLNIYRCAHDTFASYSEFYYALNSFRNGTLPLWDPYTHGGQPFYYHFTKISGGELNIIFFSLISYLFKNISILTLYHYHTTLHFLILALGCFYLARVIFQRKIISYYVLLLSLFGSYYGCVLGSHGTLMAIGFLPWFMAFFILFATGRLRPHYIFITVLISVLYIQSNVPDFIFSFYFLFLFYILYCIFFRRQLSWSRIHWLMWFFASFILCIGLLKTFAFFLGWNDLFPSIRALFMPVSNVSKIISSLGTISPSSGQYSHAFMGDYFNILNPLIGRYGGRELKFYLGFIPAFFAFYAIFALRNKFIQTLIIPGILSIWVSLGPKAFLSSFCFYALPLFKYIRIMHFFSLAPIYISFVFISAFGFNSIIEKIEYLKDWYKFWKHIERYFWFFIITGLIVTIAYLPYQKGIIKSLLTLSFYSLPLTGIALCYCVYRNLRKFPKDYFFKIHFSVLIIIILLIITMLVLSKPFFIERLAHFKIHRLTTVLVSFCIMIGYVLFSKNKNHSSVIITFCLGMIFMDLVFFTSLSTYIRVENRKGAIVPEKIMPFEYQKFRVKYFWPSGLNNVYFLRPAMLYLKSSVITTENFCHNNNIILIDRKECDFYMLKNFWVAYRRFPENVKRVIMGIDMPKLVFFTDYKEVEDESVFKECETINPELLRKFVYIAPQERIVLPAPKAQLGPNPPADINVEHFNNNRLKVSVQANEDGLLYYSDGYDKHWRCFIDDKPTPILRANVAFKAVFVPKGRHSVLFEYRPLPYIISFWLFLLSCLLCIISAFWCWRRRIN